MSETGVGAPESHLVLSALTGVLPRGGRVRLRGDAWYPYS
jgi:hypothetical protein